MLSSSSFIMNGIQIIRTSYLRSWSRQYCHRIVAIQSLILLLRFRNTLMAAFLPCTNYPLSPNWQSIILIFRAIKRWILTMAVSTQERKENCRAKENDIYKKLNFNKQFRHAMTFMPIFKRHQTQNEIQVNVARKNNGKHEFHVHFLALELVFYFGRHRRRCLRSLVPYWIE